MNSVGWQANLADIIDAGLATRDPAPFDVQARSREVDRQLAAAGGIAWWPPLVAFITLAFPAGFVWAGVIVVIWGVISYGAVQERKELRARLTGETERLKREHQAMVARVAQLVDDADRGMPAALHALLDRWHEQRPQSVRQFSAHLEQVTGGWFVVGRALERDDIPSGTPRIGRGGRTVYDKRKAAEIDEDLTELNAAAVISILVALFSGPRPKAVDVYVNIANPSTGSSIAWVRLNATLHTESMRVLLSHLRAPSEGIRALGGDVGRCRSQRLTAAREPSGRAVIPSPPPAATPGRVVTTARDRRADDLYGRRAAAVEFTPSPSVLTPAGRAQRPTPGIIPPAPVHLRGRADDGVPTVSNVRGPFATVARRFADYPGDPSARFVAFQQYWSQYSQMAPGQLKFYFKWRSAIRQGQVLRTDLSYIFVHVYELLHVVGAKDATDAARQIERLWLAYRGEYPKLDGYLVTWVADLYAMEVSQAAALDFVERAAVLGASMRSDEFLLIADQFWAKADYVGMPQQAVGALIGDLRLGDNKFYREHNGAAEGMGWVDRAYRDALGVADRVFAEANGKVPRIAEIERFGQVDLVREPFQSAVYEWKKKPVNLGRVPRLTDAGIAVPLYRNAVRHAENLLRKERGVAAKLRGVEVSPALARALDAHFGGYVKVTKPKPRVTIDLARARDLARESADIRARLLEGIEEMDKERVPNVPVRTPAVPASAAASWVSTPVPGDIATPGLLTDLAAVQAVLASISPAARGVLEALVANAWEAGERAPSLVAAAKGALVGPLIGEINERAVEGIGDVLIVHEGELLVVQDDFRDEVFWVLHGSLDGFGTSAAGGRSTSAATVSLTDATLGGTADIDTEGFGPVELEALAIVHAGAGAIEVLTALAMDHATTPLLLLDRINEAALSSSIGDLVIDVDQSPPVVLPDAEPFVSALLARAGPLLIPVFDVGDEAEEASAAAT